MLVSFTTKTYSDITMFGDVAHRAFPLIDLLAAAVKADANVTWK
jgi:hypothetical protein